MVQVWHLMMKVVEKELDEIEQARKSRKLQQSSNGISDYINLDFILGLATEVERLWSMASHVLLKNRPAMILIVFEAIVFLKINNDLWDECDIVEAISMQKSARAQ